ncbi:hypothetical protein Fcan01_25079 [Folsomia candida]|uniref:Uncharacterized protein n=1 Tax=Folsomia candida TaxID=158441 RepID=A0A226D465_FOLCA|nr:hypothetical protein Fcan01_25079 [Folsomia candida]
MDTKTKRFYSTEESRRKFLLASIFYINFCSFFIFMPTFKLWNVSQETTDPEFYTAYKLSSVSSLVFGILVNYQVHHDDFYLGFWQIGIRQIVHRVFQFLWAFTLEVSGSFHSYSTKILKSWEVVPGNTVKRKYFKKFILSIKPIGIGVEGVMIFKKLTSIKFLRAIMTGTVRSVLTMGMVRWEGENDGILMDAFSDVISTPTKENILLQPIDPIFRSLQGRPSCVIYVIIVKPESSYQYDTVVWYSIKHVMKPTIQNNWNRRRRIRYCSYFYSGMITIFGNSSAIGTVARRITLAIFRQPIILFFQISCVKNMDNMYLVETHFSTFCKNVKLSENIKLDRIIAECKKFVRPEPSFVRLSWKPQEFHKSISGLKTYSMEESLNSVLTHMLNLETNTSDDLNRISISAGLDMTVPLEISYTDSDMMHASFLLAGNWSFSFVTCSSLTQGRVDYWGYVKPFKASVYYGLMLCSLMVTILLIGQNYTKYFTLSWYQIPYAMFSTLLDVTFIIVQRSSSTLQLMFQNPASEKLLIPWTLVTFVVVNIYMSIVTEDTTAPLVSNPPSMFNQLVDGGYRLYSSPISVNRYGFLMPQSLLTYCWGMSELDAHIAARYILWKRTVSQEFHGVLVRLGDYHWCAALKTIVELRDRKSSFCDSLNSTAFYKDNHNLLTQAELEFKSTELGRISGISEVLNASDFRDCGEIRVYIMIQKWGAISEAFKDRIVKLVESGFYRFWEDLIIHVQTTGGISRKGEQAFSQQQLNSNILTIFFILSIAVGPCVVIFLCELALRKRKRIIEGLKVSLSSLVNNFRENSRIIVMQVMSAFLMRQR